MDKLVLGGVNRDNVIDFLVEDFYVVHPEISIKDGKLIKNFDLYLNFDGTITNNNFLDLLKYYSVPVIGHNRLPKWKQLEFARSLGVNVPKTYKQVHPIDKEHLTYSIFKFLEEYYENDEFVLKSENGARGIGQMIVKKNQIYDLYQNITRGNINNEYLSNNFKLGESKNFHDDSEMGFLRNSILDLDFSIMKKLSLKKEWRYIYVYGNDPIIVERKVSDAGNWQANVSVTGKGNQVIFNDADEEHLYMREKANLIAEKLNVPFLSIDFYMDNQDRIGIFEFQMQMGFKKVDKTDLTKNIVKGFKEFINDKIKNKF